MHLGNDAITPECVALTMGAAGIGLGAAAVRLRREAMSRQKLALAAGLGAMVFAAQAINVPVLPGTSAHLVGGVLLAWTLGPSLGAWTMALILAVQALVLGDGGLAALGANVLNMALLPAAMVAVCRQLQTSEGRWGHASAVLVAAASVPLAALLIVGETALFRSASELAGWQEFAVRLIGSHLWIGMIEGGLTLAILVVLARLATHGMPQRAFPTADRMPQTSSTAARLATALAIALAVVSPWSSELPDGYEAAAQQSEMGWLLGEGDGQVGNLPH
jgi:cobalt/nickel transport system permease protein